jgi:hypothetical protein
MKILDIVSYGNPATGLRDIHLAFVNKREYGKMVDICLPKPIDLNIFGETIWRVFNP